MQELLRRIKPKQRKSFDELRSALLSLPQIDESIEIDDIEGEWCPVYRVNGSDLVWIHFDKKMWVSVPLEPKFEKKILQDENLDSYVIDGVKDAELDGQVKLAKIEIVSSDHVEQILPLLKMRHSSLQEEGVMNEKDEGAIVPYRNEASANPRARDRCLGRLSVSRLE
jgi:hypothetical protein